MQQSGIRSLDEAGPTAHEWNAEISARLQVDNERTAYHALRGVLFALRDGLDPVAAARLGDRLPLMVRGVYYESYTNGCKPYRIREWNEFLARISLETSKVRPEVTPEAALQAVIPVLTEKLEDDVVQRSLPCFVRRRFA